MTTLACELEEVFGGVPSISSSSGVGSAGGARVCAKQVMVILPLDELYRSLDEDFSTIAMVLPPALAMSENRTALLAVSVRLMGWTGGEGLSSSSSSSMGAARGGGRTDGRLDFLTMAVIRPAPSSSFFGTEGRWGAKLGIVLLWGRTEAGRELNDMELIDANPSLWKLRAEVRPYGTSPK